MIDVLGKCSVPFPSVTRKFFLYSAHEQAIGLDNEQVSESKLKNVVLEKSFIASLYMLVENFWR